MTPPFQLALATSRELPQLDEDSRLLLPHLEARGITPHLVIWQDAFAWDQIDACLIRSPWDYTQHYPEFIRWLRQVDQATTLWNPLSLLLDNMEKTYLNTLHNQGVQTVPTLWTTPEKDFSGRESGSKSGLSRFRDLLSQHGFEQTAHIIVKPVVSASAYNTHRLSLKDFSEHHPEYDDIFSLFLSRPMMVQPYLPAIETVGEISMIYFQGQFHHAIRKVPAPHDFRIQEKYGGTIQTHTPAPAERDLADQTMACYSPTPLYARIDLVYLSSGNPAVIECELTEPSLYLKYHPEAASHFADNLHHALNTLSTPETV